MPELTQYPNIIFERTRKWVLYKPKHIFVNHWIFRFTENDEKNEHSAIMEANLADALARVAEDNGMSNNDVMQLFPAILRMLKSTSEWSK